MDKQVSITLTFRDLATAGLQSAVAGVSSSLTAVSRTASSTMASMALGIGNAVGNARTHLANLIKSAQLASLFIGGTFVAAAGAAIDMAAKFERFGKAAEFMTGSADAAKKFAQAVREVSLATMFNVDEIAQMESRLVGNTRNVDLSTKALKALTEAVAATGGAFPELEGATRAWIQVNSKAKLSSEELNRQFANANIPIVRLLAESIAKDLNHPLRKYIETAGSAGGASKTLTNEYKKASAGIGEFGDKLAIAKQRLKEAESSTKTKQSTLMSYRNTVQNLEQSIGKANTTIGQYTEAQKSAGKATTRTKLTVEQIMAQLQEVGDLDIPGSVGAEAITRALNEAYGGANQQLIQTFSGRLSMLKDALKLTVMSFIGLDESFKVIEGGLLDLLTRGLKPAVEWLQKNQEAITKFGRAIGGSMPFIMGLGFFLLGVMSAALILILGKILLLGAIFGGFGAAVGFVIEKLGGFSSIVNFVSKQLENLKNWYKQNELAIIIIASILTTLLLPALINTAVQGIGTLIYYLSVMSISAISQAVFGLITLAVRTVQYGLAGWGAVFAITSQVFALGLLAVQFTLNIIKIIALTAAKVAWTIVTMAATVAVWALNVAIAFLTSPIGLVILAIIALVAIGWWLIAHWDQVKAKAIEVWNAIKQWISDSVEGMKIIIKEKWKAIKQWLSDTWTGIKLMAGDIWKGIADAIIGPIKTVIDWLDKAIGKAKELIGKAGEMGAKGIKGIGGLLSRQHGGIVPGPVGSPIPIIAHGGERITPRGSNTNAPFANQGGGGTTINFYGNLTVDSEDRVKQLADTISRMLGRQNELARMGVGF